MSRFQLAQETLREKAFQIGGELFTRAALEKIYAARSPEEAKQVKATFTITDFLAQLGMDDKTVPYLDTRNREWWNLIEAIDILQKAQDQLNPSETGIVLKWSVERNA